MTNCDSEAKQNQYYFAWKEVSNSNLNKKLNQNTVSYYRMNKLYSI